MARCKAPDIKIAYAAQHDQVPVKGPFQGVALADPACGEAAAVNVQPPHDTEPKDNTEAQEQDGDAGQAAPDVHNETQAKDHFQTGNGQGGKVDEFRRDQLVAGQDMRKAGRICELDRAGIDEDEPEADPEEPINPSGESTFGRIVEQVTHKRSLGGML